MILIFRGGCFAMEWESLCADVAGDDDAEPRDGSFAACFIASPKSGVLARLACRERREEGGVEVTSGEEAGPGGGLYRHLRWFGAIGSWMGQSLLMHPAQPSDQ